MIGSSQQNFLSWSSNASVGSLQYTKHKWLKFSLFFFFFSFFKKLVLWRFWKQLHLVLKPLVPVKAGQQEVLLSSSLETTSLTDCRSSSAPCWSGVRWVYKSYICPAELFSFCPSVFLTDCCYNVHFKRLSKTPILLSQYISVTLGWHYAGD